jgi:hypothetical protein
MADAMIGWNNSKKQSEKSDKSNACANSADTHSVRQTKVKRVSYKRTTLRSREDDMENWRVVGNSVAVILGV